MRYGYVRVSSAEQNEGRQLEKMDALGISRECVFVDKASGKSLDRPAWNALRRVVRRGDVIVIDSLDRLGRNYDEVTAEWRKLTREQGVDVVALDLEFMNSENFRNMGEVGKLLEDMVLNLLAWVAQTEREKIRQRQAEGIALAKAEGKYTGRKARELGAEEIEAIRGMKDAEAMQALGVSQATYYRWKREGKLAG
ncbi:MAG: recombinase family protein [Atopobiaceae bacterium]|nr:recombinase family protein [Atopobiaceae bacterium]